MFKKKKKMLCADVNVSHKACQPLMVQKITYISKHLFRVKSIPISTTQMVKESVLFPEGSRVSLFFTVVE